MLYLAAPINDQSLIFNNIELVFKETLLANMKYPSLSIKYTIYLNYFGAETCPSGHLFFTRKFIFFCLVIFQLKINNLFSITILWGLSEKYSNKLNTRHQSDIIFSFVLITWFITRCLTLSKENGSLRVKTIKKD